MSAGREEAALIPEAFPRCDEDTQVRFPCFPSSFTHNKLFYLFSSPKSALKRRIAEVPSPRPIFGAVGGLRHGYTNRVQTSKPFLCVTWPITFMVVSEQYSMRNVYIARSSSVVTGTHQLVSFLFPKTPTVQETCMNSYAFKLFPTFFLAKVGLRNVAWVYQLP